VINNEYKIVHGAVLIGKTKTNIEKHNCSSGIHTEY
jgi:hypothetical protein